MNLNKWKDYLSEMTLGLSGWRRVFSCDRQEHSMEKNIHTEDVFFFEQVAKTISQSQKIFKEILSLANTSVNRLHIVVARDSRPTGLAIQKVLLRGLAQGGVKVSLLNVVSLPQCLAYVKKTKLVNGFVYITASHNPSGHNGLKIGNGDGKILSVENNKKLVMVLKKSINTVISKNTKSVQKLVQTIPLATSNRCYKELVMQTISSAWGKNKSLENGLIAMKQQLKNSKYWVVCDFNGSSRLRSYDRQFYRDWGISLKGLNTKVGEFKHSIVPEGKALQQLKVAMLSFQKEKQGELLFGYAVDCDGDRGNLVFAEKNNTVVKIPDAQTTFALSVWSELMFVKIFFPKQFKKLVVVANGPTSLRVDRICEQLGVGLERAEVGEINVITLAEALTKQGKVVRILGEGSNGGNITFPSTVRDPLSTVGAMLKLLFLKCDGVNGLAKTSLKSETVRLLNLPKTLEEAAPSEFLSKLIKTLNSYYSTDLFGKEGLVRLKSNDPKKFKDYYENLFEKSFKKKSFLKKELGVSAYEWINYEGTKTKRGKGNRNNYTGGLKVIFYGEDFGNSKSKQKKEIIKGFLWFRGSKTEPVLRCSAEFDSLRGQKKSLAFHRQLLEKVDRDLLQDNGSL